MTAERAASYIIAMALHAGALWLLKPGEHKMVQMAGEPEGPTVNVELVEATAPEEAPAVVETPPEPMPPEPTPPPDPPIVAPPEPTPPEPTPPDPAPTPPDEMEEPTKAAPEPVREPKPKPQPQPKPKPRPAPPQPAAKPGPPAQAAAPPSGFQGAAAHGSAKGDKGASIRRKVEPLYPSRLREMRVEPRAVILVVVGADGRVVSARVFEGSGHADWDQAALRAARDTLFNPKTVLGVPVQDTVRLPYKGRLRAR